MKLDESIRIYDENDEAIGDIRKEDVPDMGEMYVPYGLFSDYSKERLTPMYFYRNAVRAIHRWQRS